MVDSTFVFGLPFILRRPIQMRQKIPRAKCKIQGGSNMTGTFCV